MIYNFRGYIIIPICIICCILTYIIYKSWNKPIAIDNNHYKNYSSLLKYGIDECNIENGKAFISGWAISDKSIKSNVPDAAQVFLLIGNKTYQLKTRSRKRVDVAKFYSLPDTFNHSGFYASAYLPELNNYDKKTVIIIKGLEKNKSGFKYDCK